MIYRLKYLENGEWVLTGLMNKYNALEVKAWLEKNYNRVEMYIDG